MMEGGMQEAGDFRLKPRLHRTRNRKFESISLHRRVHELSVPQRQTDRLRVSGRGLDTLASSGSCHRTKAAASRRELELLLLPVGSLPTSVTCPLRSTGITPLPRYYGAVRPYPPHRYFRPHSFAACTFPLASPDRFSSSIQEPK